jgi:hypothetical protein
MYNIPGKVNYIKKAVLDIELSAGVMLDHNTWVGAKDHNKYFQDQLTPHYDQLKILVELDGEVLVDQPIDTGTICVHHDFLDSEIQTVHVLKIEVQGFQPEFNQSYQDKDAYVMIRLDNISIENLTMQYMLDQTGQYIHGNQISNASQYMGHNGHCVFEFETPIYKWLLSCHNNIKPIVDNIKYVTQ